MIRLTFSAVVVGIAVLSAMASAQSQPTRYGERDAERDPYGSINSQYATSDFPASFVAAVPDARARAAAASALHDRASSELRITISRLQREMESSAEMRQALREEQEAYLQLQDARTRTLAPILADEEVRAAEGLRKSITERIQDQHSSKAPDPQHVVALASMKLEIARQIREKEALALASDPAVVQARARYMVAAMRVNELRARNSSDIQNNDEVVAGRKALADARIAKLAGAAYLDSAIGARNIALRYAYNLHRYDYYRYGAFAGGYYYGGSYGASGTYCDPFVRVRY